MRNAYDKIIGIYYIYFCPSKFFIKLNINLHTESNMWTKN